MNITTKHPDVADKATAWEDIEHVLRGPRCVKSHHVRYLPRLPGQKAFQVEGGEVNQYADYLRRAVLLNVAKPLLARMVGLVFRRPPQVTLPASISEHLANWTLAGQTFEAFAKLVLRENCSKGFGAIGVDISDVYARPYQRLYCAQAILDFGSEEYGGRPVPKFATVSEPFWFRRPDGARERRQQVRLFELADLNFPSVRPPNLADVIANLEKTRPTEQEFPLGFFRQVVFRQRTRDDGSATDDWDAVEARIPTRRGRPLGFLPLVPFNPFAATWEVSEAPLLDVVDLILADFLVSADYHELGHKVGAGTVLFGSGFSAAEQKALGVVGGGSCILTERADSTLAYVQTSGTDATVLRNQRQDIRDQLQAIVGRLLASQQKNVAESAASQEIQFSSEDANLQNIVGATAIGLEEAAKISAWWASTAETVDDIDGVNIELNDKFLAQEISVADITGLGMEADDGRLPIEDFCYEVFVKGQRGRPGRTLDEIVADVQAARAAGASLEEAVRRVAAESDRAEQ